MACKGKKKRHFLAIALALLFPAILLADTVVTSPTTEVMVTPVVQAAAYATGEIINDGIITLTGACRTSNLMAIIQDVAITDLAAQGVNIDVVFFDGAISGYGTVNNAFTPTDANLAAYYETTVTLSTHVAFADNGASQASNVGRLVECDSAGKLYAVLVSRGAPTYASTSDLKLFVRLLQQ